MAEIEGVAEEVGSSKPDVAPILRRSAYVLAVAALDTYFHERSAEKLRAAALRGSPDDARVASYLGSVTAAEVGGPVGESFIRMRLTFKTLVAPRRIDEAVLAWGDDPGDVWRDFCFAVGSRPDRERRQLELLYDRRNQIAHEGDWDPVQLQFRRVHSSHLEDCIERVTSVAEGFDRLL
ncbi:hypothetical protein [Microbacterium sp. TS-1]|uniref:hypothetical protein n=1 Tax=Microbacterium sp. TS-1 TaxID=1344956 RepID=UPI001183509D|nr:hypothetical protein [Microbacterium sp. TS-1]